MKVPEQTQAQDQMCSSILYHKEQDPPNAEARKRRPRRKELVRVCRASLRRSSEGYLTEARAQKSNNRVVEARYNNDSGQGWR